MPKRKSHYHRLKQKWLKRHKVARKALYEKHKEAVEWLVDRAPAKDKLASTAVGALMLASTLPATSSAAISQIPQDPIVQQQTKVDATGELVEELNTKLPAKVRPLSADEEIAIGWTLSKYYGVSASATVGDKRLNRSYGMIGAEQHLRRYPGDAMATHLSRDIPDYKTIYSSGMAPGNGAWGLFTNSKAQMTDTDIKREKWYIAVQTFAAPGYNSRLVDYRGFFKYRKMLVVNPDTGQAVVTDIADAGPAIWTGKHLGGSPEVMHFLGLSRGPRKGAVLYFFVDDADDKIPLGPIKAEVNETTT